MRTTVARTALPTTLLFLLASCKVYDPLYCDDSHRCDDPARPFCDVNGEYPDSEGIGRTCIPEPDMVFDASPAEGDGGATPPDAGAAKAA
jgi:hypothetical protein